MNARELLPQAPGVLSVQRGGCPTEQGGGSPRRRRGAGSGPSRAWRLTATGTASFQPFGGIAPRRYMRISKEDPTYKKRDRRFSNSIRGFARAGDARRLGNQLHSPWGGSHSRKGCWRRWRTSAAAVACPSPPNPLRCTMNPSSRHYAIGTEERAQDRRPPPVPARDRRSAACPRPHAVAARPHPLRRPHPCVGPEQAPHGTKGLNSKPGTGA